MCLETADALIITRLSRKWDRRCVIYEPEIDTTLIPLRTQYGATRSKAGKGNPSKYTAFATPCIPLQRLMDHS
jgi:hypothetical protein